MHLWHINNFYSHRKKNREWEKSRQRRPIAYSNENPFICVSCTANVSWRYQAYLERPDHKQMIIIIIQMRRKFMTKIYTFFPVLDHPSHIDWLLLVLFFIVSKWQRDWSSDGMLQERRRRPQTIKSIWCE